MANNIRSGLSRSVLPQLSSPRPNPNARTPQQALQEMTRIMGSATQKYQPGKVVVPWTGPGDGTGAVVTVVAGTSTGWVFSKLKGLEADDSVSAAYFSGQADFGAPQLGVAICEYIETPLGVVAQEITRSRVTMTPSMSMALPVTFPSPVRLYASKSYCVGTLVECDGVSQASYATLSGGAGATPLVKASGTYADGATFFWDGGSTGPVALVAGDAAFVVLSSVNAGQASRFLPFWY